MASAEATVYKIKIDYFLRHFSEEAGDPVGCLRLQTMRNSNWLTQQLGLLNFMDPKLEFKKEDKHVNPQRREIFEVPYKCV